MILSKAILKQNLYRSRQNYIIHRRTIRSLLAIKDEWDLLEFDGEKAYERYRMLADINLDYAKDIKQVIKLINDNIKL